MNIKIHTYPDGRADHLDPYDQILRINDKGDFVLQQAGEGLRDGDQYAIPPQVKLPARKVSDVMRYFATKGLTHTWSSDLDGKLDYVEIHQEGKFDPLVRYPFNGDCFTSLVQAIEHIMDQDEL